MGAYSSLFNIKVAHDYFANGICPSLNFIPTIETRRMMENTGILLHKQAGGIRLSYDEARVEALKLYGDDESEPLSFDFKVYADDPDFRSYTEPFAADMGTIIYFDNRSSDDVGADGIRLHQGDYVSKIDLITLDSPQIKDMISHTERLIPPVFVIRIFARVGGGALIDHWLSADVMEYRIAFKARQTVWKYFFCGGSAVQDSYIFDPGGEVEFEALGQTTLAGDREALTFRSAQSIPLRQYYDYRFQLKTKTQEGEKVLIKRLPVACVSSAGKEAGAEQEIVVSEIYVNS